MNVTVCFLIYEFLIQDPNNITQQPVPVTSPDMQPVVQPMGQPVMQPVMQPVEQPMGQPVMQPVMQPMGQPMMQPMGQPMMQPMMQPVGKPQIDGIQQPVVMPGAQPQVVYGMMAVQPEPPKTERQLALDAWYCPCD